MTSSYRIVKPHVVKRTALRELGHLFTVQEAAQGIDATPTEQAAAQVTLNALKVTPPITPTTPLKVRHYAHRFYKWAVVAA